MSNNSASVIKTGCYACVGSKRVSKLQRNCAMHLCNYHCGDTMNVKIMLQPHVVKQLRNSSTIQCMKVEWNGCLESSFGCVGEYVIRTVCQTVARNLLLLKYRSLVVCLRCPYIIQSIFLIKIYRVFNAVCRLRFVSTSVVQFYDYLCCNLHGIS